MMTLTQLETEIFALPIHERTTLVQRLLIVKSDTNILGVYSMKIIKCQKQTLMR